MLAKSIHSERIPLFQAGAILRGKWKHREYRMVGRVGEGANGVVYEAYRGPDRVAIKFALDSASLAIEYERLQFFSQQVQGLRLGPVVFELDDVRQGNEWYPILVMELINGLPLDKFLGKKGRDYIPLCLLRILNRLSLLHEQGYAFCDIKPSNILFDEGTAEPVLIDFGGVTIFGNAVKEFTERYDRAWWGKGSRKAEASYDVFACAMLAADSIFALDGREVERLGALRPQERAAWLDAQIHNHMHEHEFLSILLPALSGRVCALQDLRQSLLQYLVRQPQRASVGAAGMIKTSRSITRVRRRWDVTDWTLLVAVLLFAGTLWITLWLGGW